MFRVVTALVLLVFTFQSHSQEIKKVLFLGNSYTFANDLPNTLSKLVSSKGDSLIHGINAGGGQRLSGHAADPNTYVSFKKNTWDYIVLQEQSQLPSFPPSQVQSDVFPYAKKLCDSIHALPGCIKPVFFMTWGRKNGDQSNCKFYTPLCTYQGMQLELRKNYLTMATTNNAFASPVGMVWREIRKKWPLIDLYDADESHPKPAGTYAAACTFYAVLYGKSPINSSYKGGLSNAEADNIQKAAHAIVFDSLKTWNISRDTLVPSFSYSSKDDTVTFTYTGSPADSLHWDFGNGITSNGNAPTHIFGVSDSFLVTLTAFKNCLVSDSSENVVVKTKQPSVSADFGFSIVLDTVAFGYNGSQADSVKWYFGDGNTSSSVAPIHIYGIADTFDVKLKAYYFNAVDSITKKVITTLRDIPNGIENFTQSKKLSVIIAPNPISNNTVVKCNEIITSLEIMDINGRLLKSFQNINENTFVIGDMFGHQGIFIIRIQSTDNVAIRRVVKNLNH